MSSFVNEQTAAPQKEPLEALITGIARGDKAAVSALYEETKSAVYGFALSILKNPSDAEDVMQGTYVRIWQAAERYSPGGKPMAWVLTIARNLALSTLRERSRIAELPEESWLSLEADSRPDATEDRLVLDAAMCLLSQSEREIVMLHAVAGLKHIEIARLLSLPLPTVLSKYSRARKKLQGALKEAS